MAAQGLEHIPFAGASHAFATVDQKQRAMMGAVDQAGAVVEKGVLRPVQWDTAMWAAVAVKMHMTVAAHAEKVDAVYAEGAAMALGQGRGRTDKVHCWEGS